MKYSMMTYTIARQATDGKPDMVDICRFAKELGIDAMDQCGLYGYDPKEIRRIADDYDIKIICYTFSANLNFPDAESRKPGLEAIREGLEIAHILGAPIIMLPIGGKKELTRQQSRKNVIEGLKEAAKLATAANIKLSAEHFTGVDAPFLTSSDMKEAIEQIPDFYVTYDAGNVLIAGENPVDSFLKTKNKIIHAHFKDWTHAQTDGCEVGAARKGLDGKFYCAALIGEGLVDYPRVLQTMKDAGYDGYINIEYEGNKYSAKQAVRLALDYLRQVEQNL